MYPVKDAVYKNKYKILGVLCLFCGLLSSFTAWKQNFEYPNQLFIAVCFCFVFFCYYKIYKNEKISEKNIAFLILALGFVLRLNYIQVTGHLIRQHDVGGENGHLEYIMRLYNGEGLANTVKWQYYQPPVWHFLCAVWLKIQTFFGVAMNAALENLQLISLFCSSTVMLLSHKLFKLFGLNGASLCVPLAIVSFHPSFIMLAGSINNDILSITLSLLAVVLAVEWYRRPNLLKIIALALAIGFSMGVKLSGGLVSVGVALLFAILFFKKEANKKQLFSQFAVFGVICIPIALWWQLRNYILFKIPPTYVPMLSQSSNQYIGFRSVYERLFDFSSIIDNGVYPARVLKTQAFEYFEYNIPLGALKSAVFGEYYIGKGTSLEIFANILFWSSAILALISVVAAIWSLITAIKEKKLAIELISVLIIGATLIFSYVKFCFTFAHFCTMDFRYIALTLVLGSLYIGLLIKNAQKNNKMFGMAVSVILICITFVMAFTSFVFYSSIA